MSKVAELAENCYGKSRVRLVRVNRRASGNDFREWELQILLKGDFTSCFEQGDNSKILPTDTMKNTVYSLARTSVADSIEDFAKELTGFLLRRNPQVSAAKVTINEKQWEHLSVKGTPHPTAFVQSSGERQTTVISRTQSGSVKVASGLENLVIMKTADSEFVGYIKDSHTTLPEATDRLFGTSAWAQWKYRDADAKFALLRTKVRSTMLEVFANHKSKSVQHTLYAMAEKVLETVSEVEEIELRMPNLHCLLVDLSRFGQDNPSEVFVPIDEPYGYIEARVRRQGRAG